MKRDKLDKVISDLVRERAEWTCEKCGKVFPEGFRQGLHCSHLYSRRHASTRHFGGNLFAHCFACHQYLGGNPIEFAAWARSQLGDTALESLGERHHRIVRRRKKEKEEMYQHFKAEYKALMDKRKAGETGYISFVEWD